MFFRELSFEMFLDLDDIARFEVAAVRSLWESQVRGEDLMHTGSFDALYAYKDCRHMITILGLCLSRIFHPESSKVQEALGYKLDEMMMYLSEFYDIAEVNDDFNFENCMKAMSSTQNNKFTSIMIMSRYRYSVI
jgi:hypothetical protein